MKDIAKKQHQLIKRLMRSLKHQIKCGCDEGVEESFFALDYAEKILQEYENEVIRPKGNIEDGWFFQPWVCVDCKQTIPSRMQYHDCKGGTLL